MICFDGEIEYSRNADGSLHIDLKMRLPDEPEQIVLLQPAIEALMAAFARNSAAGFEAALECLHRGAMRQDRRIRKGQP